MSSALLPVNPSGKRIQPRIAFIGEYPEDEDMQLGIMFTGRSGALFRTMLRECGVVQKDCYYTSVFRIRPIGRTIEEWTTDKRGADREWKETGLPGKYPMPAIFKGKYLQAQYLSVVDNLRKELLEVQPNMIVALGATASWAVFHSSMISKLRGTVRMTSIAPTIKGMPTYAPGQIFTQWDMKPILQADLAKAGRLSETAELVVPSRKIWIKPTLADLFDFYQRYIEPSDHLSVDVETKAKQITCIGFSPSPYAALVIPFWDTNSANPNYWKTPEEERVALQFVSMLMRNPKFKKRFQNGLYDLQYIWKTWGIPCHGPIDDTMLLHHAIQPELPKGLGFLGSIYTSEPAWKSMRTRKSDTDNIEERDK